MKKFLLIAALIAGTGLLYQFSPAQPPVGTNIGDMAPDIVMESPDGKSMSLSSLRGKYVLIDFWASWCRPCRMENPNVVSAYHKYQNAKWDNGKGFDVFSVSLDRAKGAWKKAIEADKLEWAHHVSDLQFWNNAAAKTYGVRSIPASFLVDPDGVIIAKNLRGMRLHTELDKHVKAFKKPKGKAKSGSAAKEQVEEAAP